MMARFFLVLALSLPLGALGVPVLDQPFPGSDGQDHTLREILGEGDLLVITFFSATCPCQRAHDPRLIELHTQWHPRGVRFVSVDSEADSSLERDMREQKERAYPFPILSDPGGKLADAFGAKFATYTVILNRDGERLYQGGIDNDRSHLRPNAKQYVKLALENLAQGKSPDPKVGKAMGCFLRRR